MKKLFFLSIVMAFSITATAQRSVSGQVLEKDTDIPLLGVSILVKGTDKGASSDFDGNFELKTIDDNAILVFSYIGYSTQEIEVGNRNTIKVYLELNAQQMDEVVVTALNIQRDKESLG